MVGGRRDVRARVLHFPVWSSEALFDKYATFFDKKAGVLLL